MKEESHNLFEWQIETEKSPLSCKKVERHQFFKIPLETSKTCGENI